MASTFFFAALIGGTITVCQFVLTLVGFGHEGGDAHGADAGHDAETPLGDSHTSSTWLFGVLTVRTIVAAVTFFGLAGMAMNSAEQSIPAQLTVALLAGAGALFGVHWLMRTMLRLGEDHTVRIARAVGQPATVYVPIPPNQGGIGKVHLKLQDRLMEYSATTTNDETLPTGATVVVVGVSSANALEVLPRVQQISDFKSEI